MALVKNEQRTNQNYSILKVKKESQRRDIHPKEQMPKIIVENSKIQTFVR